MKRYLTILASLLIFDCRTTTKRDPLIGRWKLDVATSQSKEVDGTIVAEFEGPRSINVFYERLRTDGTRRSLRYTYSPSCVDCAVVGGEEGLTVARKRIGLRTYQTVWKIKGRIITTSRNVYSSDLQTLTNTADVIDDAGHHSKTVHVWRRQ